MKLPPFSTDDANSYAVFRALVDQPIHADKAIVFRHYDGVWEYTTEVDVEHYAVLLHIAIQAPTMNLLERILAAISPYGIEPQFFLHPLSDLDNATIGLLLPLNCLPDEENKAAITEQLSRFELEYGFTEHAPQISQPGLLVMDMDSTVIACECIDEIAVHAGVGDEVAAVTERAMQGELDFAQSLSSRVACLKGLDVTALEQVKQQLPLMPGLTRLIATLHHYQWRIAIASGGFTFFAEHLQQRLGLDAAVANELAVVDGQLTGEVVGDIVDAQTKAKTVVELAEQWQLSHSQTVAMGDGANDLVMMSAAQLGIAFHAKPVVQAKADVAIRRQGLDAALLLMRF
ncbi:phosphoserine phosphatase SerB [Alteromonas sp. ASW11-36]|uniref:Phosphoserine phosphatase n=1 Tax=Alteromonas arenosi TaxID=3055817 RepID=A0ABT7SUA1_9ALTE|nr:phosphoserine phosphatase SerB [Alteromonas sp. ASW11-36]MDM7859765.1 phosphoserine phosphatase SerB [Alteromonas sp. ASW11-36]